MALHGPTGPAGRWLAEHGADFSQVRFERYAGGTPRNPFRDAAFIARWSGRLARYLREQRVAIVHANDIWMMGTWSLACKLAGVKLIWHHRSNARFQLAHRLAFRAADRMIAVSPYAAGARSRDPKCTIIGNPFRVEVGVADRAIVRSRLLGELGLTEPVHVLGFFANLKAWWSERKRPLVLVQAVARLKAIAPERTFVGAFYGTINEFYRAQILEEAERLGVKDRIFIMGFRDPVDTELVAVDTVVAPAVGEGFGRVPVEAMLVGTPVIASDSGNHPALVRDGETGGLVAADDPPALAEKVLWLSEDRARRDRIVERARQEARGRFGAEASARAVMQVYAELTGGRRPDARHDSSAAAA